MNGFELIFIIGGMMLFGHLMGRLAKRIKLPELAGIIAAGILIKVFLVYVFKKEDILENLLDSLHILVSIALGLEAFSIGSEMTVEEQDNKYSYIKLLGLQSIVVVAFTSLSLLIMRDLKFSLLIGAIVGATAPIAIVELIKGYNKKGKIKRGLNKMISFDNIIPIIYFFIIYAIVRQTAEIGLNMSFKAILGELSAILIGIGVGLILLLLNKLFVRKIKNQQEKDIAYIFIILSVLLMAIMGAIFISESQAFKDYFVSEFVVAFIAGMVFGNLIQPEENHRQVHVLHNFIPPLLTVFFVYVGMELSMELLIGKLGIFLVCYIIVLSLFKILFAKYHLKKIGVNEKFVDYIPFAVITKSSFEIYLAHLAMIATHNDAIFIVVLISIILFETIEPIVLSKTTLNNLNTGIIKEQ